MKITYLIPGSGDNFYCDNCQRDTLYVSWLKKLENIEISAIPLYLPPGEKNFGSEIENEVFFGAVSLYLKEKVPLFKSLPSFVDKILDFDVINKNANFNLIPSLIDDKVLNFGSVEYCENLKQKYGTFICPVVASNHKDFKCGRECSYCVTKKNVCFVEH